MIIIIKLRKWIDTNCTIEQLNNLTLYNRIIQSLYNNSAKMDYVKFVAYRTYW